MAQPADIADGEAEEPPETAGGQAEEFEEPAVAGRKQPKFQPVEFAYGQILCRGHEQQTIANEKPKNLAQR